jgi:gas vesicle protein
MNETTFKLNEQQIAGFMACGATFAESETDIAGAVKAFVDLVTVGKNGSWINGSFVEDLNSNKVHKVPDFNLWVAGMEEVKRGYAKVKGLSNIDNDAVKGMWKRFTRNVSDLHGISKPAKPTDTGKAKAEQRSKALIAKQELAKRDIEDLQAEIIELSAKPSKENVKLTSKLLDAVAYKQKAENKDFDAEIKTLKKEIKEQVTKCEDLALLQDISNMFD